MAYKAVLAALVVLAGPLVAPAFADPAAAEPAPVIADMSSGLAELLGKDPGTAAAYSCFSRHYDAAHLSAHPRQNVRDMSVFVQSTYDPTSESGEKRTNSIEIGLKFRGLSKPFEISGGCYTTVDGQAGLSCGADCDGGHFDVSAGGRDGAAVSIPDGVSIWDPAASDADPPGDLPRGARLGRDDKLFQLDRVDLKQCLSLMSDEARHDLFGTPLPPDQSGDDADATDAAPGDAAASDATAVAATP